MIMNRTGLLGFAAWWGGVAAAGSEVGWDAAGSGLSGAGASAFEVVVVSMVKLRLAAT
jgi:hypothetical protein